MGETGTRILLRRMYPVRSKPAGRQVGPEARSLELFRPETAGALTVPVQKAQPAGHVIRMLCLRPGHVYLSSLELGFEKVVTNFLKNFPCRRPDHWVRLKSVT